MAAGDSLGNLQSSRAHFFVGYKLQIPRDAVQDDPVVPDFEEFVFQEHPRGDLLAATAADDHEPHLHLWQPKHHHAIPPRHGRYPAALIRVSAHLLVPVREQQ